MARRGGSALTNIECAKAEVTGTPKTNATIKMTGLNMCLPGEPIIDPPCARLWYPRKCDASGCLIRCSSGHPSPLMMTQGFPKVCDDPERKRTRLQRCLPGRAQ